MIPATDARYINHSCESNRRIDRELRVVTTRPVAAGEELAYDYVRVTREEFENGRFWDERWTFECKCGSPECLGTIDRYIVVDE